MEIELQNIDSSSPSNERSLEEIHRSWLLRPAEKTQKKKLTLCCFLLRRKLVLLILAAFLVTAGLSVMLKTLPSRSHDHHKKQQMVDNYTVALHLALGFFNAQRSGVLPHDNNISWRGDACLEDGNGPTSKHKHLSGGFFDAGRATKSSSPMSLAITMLSWSVIEYSSEYQRHGELSHVKELIKWGSNYLLNTFNDSDTMDGLVSKIGSTKSSIPNERSCWMRPEDISYPRPVAICYNGCPDLAADMAAALASASIVFKYDASYSLKLSSGAKILYAYAESMRDSADLLIWGGAWLYYATGDLDLLNRVTSHDLPNHDVLLLARLRIFLDPGYPYEENLHVFHDNIGRVMCAYMPFFNTFKRTKGKSFAIIFYRNSILRDEYLLIDINFTGGLIRLQPGDTQLLQYAASAAFLAKLYSDYLDAIPVPGWTCGPKFYRSEVDYILGKNPQNMSYVVGFGERYPRHVHHRGASIPKNENVSCEGGWKWRDAKTEDPNTIEGAMVAGPDKEDMFYDVRTSDNYTEPSIVGNAGLVAALVAVSSDKPLDIYGIFYNIPPMYPLPPPPPKPWSP
ncbi:unnamed protein product [Cochlearia groenlandica]